MKIRKIEKTHLSKIAQPGKFLDVFPSKLAVS